MYVKSIERDLEAGQPSLARNKGATRPPCLLASPCLRRSSATAIQVLFSESHNETTHQVVSEPGTRQVVKERCFLMLPGTKFVN